MSGSKYYVWGGGRWREVDTSTGAVEGWPGRARFVYVRRGRLQVARSSRVLAALRGLAAGQPSAARDGPRLSQYSEESEAHSRRSRRRSPAPPCRHRHHCCGHCQGCNINSSKSAPQQCDVGVQHAPRGEVSLQKGTAEEHVARTSPPTPPPPRAPALPSLLERPAKNQCPSSDEHFQPARKRTRAPREESRAAPSEARGSSSEEAAGCKELTICESDVAALRSFVARTRPDALQRFDADLEYRRALFYAINPLVSVPRCSRTERALQRSSALPHFAARLGLRPARGDNTASESSDSDYERDTAPTRNKHVSASHTRKNITVAESDETECDQSSTSDSENNLPLSAHKHAATRRSARGSDRAETTESESVAGRRRLSLRKRATAPADTVRTSSRKAAAHNKSYVEESTSESQRDSSPSVTLARATSVDNSSRIPTKNTSPRVAVSGPADTGADSVPRTGSAVKRDYRGRFLKLTRTRIVNGNAQTPSNISASDTSKRASSSSERQDTSSSQKRASSSSQRQDTRSSQKRASGLSQKQATSSPQKRASSSSQRQNTRTSHKRASTSSERQDTTSSQKRASGLSQKQATSSSQRQDTRSSHKRVSTSSERPDTSYSQQAASSSQRLDTSSSQKSASGLSQKQVTSSSHRRAAKLSLQRRTSNSPQKKASSSSHKQVSSGSNVVQKQASGSSAARQAAGASSSGAAEQDTHTISKRAGGGSKEYSSLEDHAIVSWVSGGARARRVNGNKLWRELQDCYPQLTGRSRSWHSLRNRYLRYILPALGALRLPPAHESRLRAAAATGEIKHKRNGVVIQGRRNSIFEEAPVKAASARRPAPPASPPPRAPSPPPRAPSSDTTDDGASVVRRRSSRLAAPPAPAAPAPPRTRRLFNPNVVL